MRRVEAALSWPAQARDGAAAKDRIVGELAREERGMRAQIAELGGGRRAPAKGRLARVNRRVRRGPPRR